MRKSATPASIEKYYIMITNVELLPAARNRIDITVMEMLQRYPVILAGGAVRDAWIRDPIVDYDIFFTSATELPQVKEFLVYQGFKEIFACPKGELFTYRKIYSGADALPDFEVKIQLICKWTYLDVDDLMDSFDFNACRFALDKANVIYTYPEAMTDVATKELSIHKITYPSSSINRLYKYRNKGYYVGNAIKTIVQSIANMGRLYDELEDTLYVD